MTDTSLAQQNLASRQNSDGGWPYTRGVSWTEPTVYALLSLLDGGPAESLRHGFHWLQTLQRPDGGWPPQARVDQSTWVTALVGLLPPEPLGEAVHARAMHWVAGSAGAESATVFRIREWLLGHQPVSQQETPGWPWIPETAAWVAPTSVAVLALQKQCRTQPRPDLQKRLDEGRRFLLERMCQGGGWNHGSTRPLGYPTNPYPETTGLALIALRGVQARQIEISVPLALRYLKECRSADAWNWLRLGLLAQGRLPAGAAPAADLRFRSIPEVALNLIAQQAFEGRNPLFV